MAEAQHLIEVLEETKNAIDTEDAARLKELSNYTIHDASIFQDTGNISMAILVYTLSKLIVRKDFERIEKWNEFLEKLDYYFDLAIADLEEDDFNMYEKHLQKARESINIIEKDIRPYIQEVMRKASVNKGSKLYEHGISVGQVAHILGLTEWELLEYAGEQTKITDIKYNITLTAQKRAKMAMEFLS